MITIGIIGTAGRKEDKAKLDKESYDFMYHSVGLLISTYIREDYRVVSGGASYADHLAVKLYLEGKAKELTLHLPCSFYFEQPSFWNERIEDFKHPANILNYYHKLFIKKTGIHSTREIAEAIIKGANVVVSPGFLNRNLKVARDADVMVALTFGDGAYLKDGGTAHTMSYFYKKGSGFRGFHINLNDHLTYYPALLNKVD